MVEWNDTTGTTLFVGRSRDDVTPGIAEVWKYRYVTGTDADWTRVVDTSDATNGMNRNNTDISMIVVNGGHLYIGFDNETNGAEVWRTTTGVEAASFADHNDLERIGVSGLGILGAPDLDKNKYIISHVSIAFGGKAYLYVTVGCNSDFTDNGFCDRDREWGSTDFAIRMFRQVD